MRGAAYLGMISAFCPVCGVAIGAGLLAYAIYDLIDGGAERLVNQATNTFSAKGTVEDAFGIGTFVGGIATAGVAETAFAAGGEAFAVAEDAACGGGLCPCFIAGTRVDADSGGKPIEEIELGERVGPELEECGAPELAQWREVDLVMDVQSEGTSDELEIRLLRPEGWIRTHHAVEGHFIGVELDDLNVAGKARVTRLGTAGHVAAGKRCPVTGWVRHTSHDVIALSLEGGEMLKVTRHHRLFSADRDDWVHAGDLAVGETLRTKEGAVHVVSVGTEALAPVEVFNLEVIEAHQYFVSEHGVLAHNAYLDHAANFDEARTLAFERAGMTEGDVTFTKVDPETGTVVEFKGPGGAKVAYDSPHAEPGPGHDMPHVGWQSAGKRGLGAERGNITYDGPQHPFRSATKGVGNIEE